MLVEDEADLAHFMGVMLSFYEVEVVSWLANYQLLLGPEHWHGIDVAVVDRLLGHDEPRGEEVLAYLAEHLPGIRRILLTAYPTAHDHDCAHVVLTKPTPAQALLTAIGVQTSG